MKPLVCWCDEKDNTESLRNRNGSIADREGCPVLQEPLLQRADPPWPSQTQQDGVDEFGTWNVFHAAQFIFLSFATAHRSVFSQLLNMFASWITVNQLSPWRFRHWHEALAPSLSLPDFSMVGSFRPFRPYQILQLLWHLWICCLIFSQTCMFHRWFINLISYTIYFSSYAVWSCVLYDQYVSTSLHISLHWLRFCVRGASLQASNSRSFVSFWFTSSAPATQKIVKIMQSTQLCKITIHNLADYWIGTMHNHQWTSLILASFCS